MCLLWGPLSSKTPKAPFRSTNSHFSHLWKRFYIMPSLQSKTSLLMHVSGDPILWQLLWTLMFYYLWFLLYRIYHHLYVSGYVFLLWPVEEKVVCSSYYMKLLLLSKMVAVHGTWCQMWMWYSACMTFCKRSSELNYPRDHYPKNQNKWKTLSKLEMALSLLIKSVTSQVNIILGSGCEWF